MKNLKNEQGFTLVELMVVVGIIGILAAIAVPNYRSYVNKSRSSEAKIRLGEIYTAETSFFSDEGAYASCLNFMGVQNNSPDAWYTVGFETDYDVTDNPSLPAGCEGGGEGSSSYVGQRATGNNGSAPTMAAVVAQTGAGTGSASINAFNAAAGAWIKDGLAAQGMDTWTIDENRTLERVAAFPY